MLLRINSLARRNNVENAKVRCYLKWSKQRNRYVFVKIFNALLFDLL